MRPLPSIPVLLLCAGLAACSQSKKAEAPAAPPPTPAERQAALASLPAPYNTGDLANGEKQFALCKSCHTIIEGAPNMTGPNLYGVFGRHAGKKEGYSYSDTLEKADFVWDASHLDAWLTDPRGYLPGTKMTFIGIKDAKDRIDLIAFLKVETGYRPE